MMRLSEAASALNARYSGADAGFDRVSTDTRTLQRGDLFVALRGDRFDAHQFIDEAVAAGAAAAMVDEKGLRIEDRGLSAAFPRLIVKDTKKALGELASYWRRKFDLPIVALTGSSGKTTVKEMLACILHEACSQSSILNPQSCVLATRGNLNNDIGVPLMLLELRPEHRYAVIEMGMNHVGEIAYLTRLTAPSVALVNNAGRAHIEFLGSEEAIARAKGEIYEGLAADGIAVINADDAHAPLWREMTAGKRHIEFGVTHGDVTGRYRLGWLESEIVIGTPYGEVQVRMTAPGTHNVSNALAAAAAAVALKIPTEAIATGLSRFSGVKGRLQKKATRQGAILIDDTYNANPDSVAAAIAVLSAAPDDTILVFGDMGELGTNAPQFHAELGTRARAAGIGRLFTLGKLSVEAARTFGSDARHFERVEDLLSALEPLLGPHVAVLVKGSRFMKMERVVQALESEGKP